MTCCAFESVRIDCGSGGGFPGECRFAIRASLEVMAISLTVRSSSATSDRPICSADPAEARRRRIYHALRLGSVACCPWVIRWVFCLSLLSSRTRTNNFRILHVPIGSGIIWGVFCSSLLSFSTSWRVWHDSRYLWWPWCCLCCCPQPFGHSGSVWRCGWRWKRWFRAR